nr:MAG TPA: hypothetical protein [Bacteriophage sp.]
MSTYLYPLVYTVPTQIVDTIVTVHNVCMRA